MPFNFFFDHLYLLALNLLLALQTLLHLKATVCADNLVTTGQKCDQREPL